MPVTDVSQDLDNCALTMTAEFAAPVERVWSVYANRSSLEKVWGPPGYPATFVKHDFEPGGMSHYFMTSPEGEKYYGWWRIVSVDPHREFVFEDGFSVDDTFANSPDMPVSRSSYVFETIDTGTRAVFTTTYASREALQHVLDMGVIEGASAAIGQIDELLAAG